MVWLVVAALFALQLRRPSLVFQVGLSVLVAELASILLKLALDRDRPPLGNPDPEPLVRLPHTPSFPSGHATVSFAAAATLAYAVPRYRMAFYTLAALIACSRVWVGVHFPLDVLAGAVLGIGIARALRLLLGAPRRSDPPLPPG